MTGIRVEITRFVDDSFPGFVECHFTDVSGRQVAIIEKVPGVTLAHLDAESAYPQPGLIACTVIVRRRAPERDTVLVDTDLPWHIESTTGETRFELLASQIVEFDWSHV